MRSNQMFDSPIVNTSHFVSTFISKPEQSSLNYSTLFSSTENLPISVDISSKNSFIGGNESPWYSIFNNQPEYKVVHSPLKCSEDSNEINEKLIFSDEEYCELTPQNYQQDKKQPPTAIKKIDNKRDKPARKPRTVDKGLKAIAKLSLEFVMKNSSLKYLQLGNILIKELFERKILNSEKQIYSIKRRVYDVLNVMVSAQVLKKQGKYISGKQIELPYKNQMEKWKKVSHNYKILKFKLNEKKKKLEESKTKLEVISTLINRNEYFQDELSSIKQSKIPIPFVCYLFQETSLASSESYHLNGSYFSLRCERPWKILGDIDCLKHLKSSLNKNFKNYNFMSLEYLQIREEPDEDNPSDPN